ncbi:MAG: hypothetical protein C4326_02730 [Ignavibacteria bacterium]
MPDQDIGTNRHEMRIGLCADCLHHDLVRSAKSSEFHRCLRSAGDPQFPKYPRLPVFSCSGYEQRQETQATG